MSPLVIVGLVSTGTLITVSALLMMWGMDADRPEIIAVGLGILILGMGVWMVFMVAMAVAIGWALALQA